MSYRTDCSVAIHLSIDLTAVTGPLEETIKS